MSSSECNIETGIKYSGHNLYPLGAETQEECAAACLGEPECHFWTHNAKVLVEKVGQGEVAFLERV